MFFKLSTAPFTLINVNRSIALLLKEMEIATFLMKAAGQFCLVSYWLILSFPGFFITPGQ
jgi:hypothetical protein